jgi:hypothetical protein
MFALLAGEKEPLTVGELSNVNADAESLEAPVKLMVATPPATLRLVMRSGLGPVPDLTTR